MRAFRLALAAWASIVALLVGGTLASAGEQRLPQGTIRLGGADRYGTSVAISKRSFTAPVEAVFIATGAAFPDALAGGPAAARLGGPVLLVRKDGVPRAVKDEIQRLKPKNIYVLGGPDVVRPTVLGDLRQLTSGRVARLHGENRYETAAQVSRSLWTSRLSTVFVASGASFPDALSGGAAAAHLDAPLLLTAPHGLPSATRTELARLKPSRVYVLGGSAAVAPDVVTGIKNVLPGVRVVRLHGADRYATSAKIVTEIWRGTEAVFYATGSAFPDALSATPAAHVNEAPLLLVKDKCLTSAVMRARETVAPWPLTSVLVGGTSVLPTAAYNTECGWPERFARLENKSCKTVGKAEWLVSFDFVTERGRSRWTDVRIVGVAGIDYFNGRVIDYRTASFTKECGIS